MIEIIRTDNIKIVIVGVGGAGTNIVNKLIDSDIADKVKFITIHRTAHSLLESQAESKIQIGKPTKGLGPCRYKPEIIREMALEKYEDIRVALNGADIVFISAGFGGATGTGATPVVAQIAKEVGALPISVVTKPFKFEGKKRLKIAEDGLEELKKESDCVIAIPNNQFLSITYPRRGFSLPDDIVYRGFLQIIDHFINIILKHIDNIHSTNLQPKALFDLLQEVDIEAYLTKKNQLFTPEEKKQDASSLMGYVWEYCIKDHPESCIENKIQWLKANGLPVDSDGHGLEYLLYKESVMKNMFNRLDIDYTKLSKKSIYQHIANSNEEDYLDITAQLKDKKDYQNSYDYMRQKDPG